jgi:hypothetical protein
LIDPPRRLSRVGEGEEGMSSLETLRITLPEPIGGLRPARRERQRWQRLGRAEGELDLGYDAEGRLVRVEYHWLRHLSRANPDLDDVYTAELWARRADGDWLYLVRPGGDAFAPVRHADVRRLFAQHLNLDAGD